MHVSASGSICLIWILHYDTCTLLKVVIRNTFPTESRNTIIEEEKDLWLKVKWLYVMNFVLQLNVFSYFHLKYKMTTTLRVTENILLKEMSKFKKGYTYIASLRVYTVSS